MISVHKQNSKLNPSIQSFRIQISSVAHGCDESIHIGVLYCRYMVVMNSIIIPPLYGCDEYQFVVMMTSAMHYKCMYAILGFS